MLLSETARTRARSLSAIGAGLSLALAAAVWFGMNEHDPMLVVPVLASVAAAAWPTRIVVAVAMVATAIVVVLGIDGSGALFGASAAVLMLALNNLQSAATRIRRLPRRSQSASA